jgi:hypothetical protein
MSNIFNVLAEDTRKLEELSKTSLTLFEQQIIKRIFEISGENVFRVGKTDPAVITLASRISNMEILLSEAGQSFSLSTVRTQPDYGASEVTWVVSKLKKHMPDKLLRRAVNHLITGSEVTKNRNVFLSVMGASVFVVNYVDSLVQLIGYARAFACKSIYELADLFNFHIVRQDYSQDVIRWFYNNTHSSQGTVV